MKQSQLNNHVDSLSTENNRRLQRLVYANRTVGERKSYRFGLLIIKHFKR